MALLVVCVGQCGNQLGDELFSQLSVITDKGKVPSPFFTKDQKARCVLVDTEPKVVQGVSRRHKDIMRPENVVFGQSGRGNNWALGYYGINSEASKRSEHHAASRQRAFANLSKGQREQDESVLARALRAIHLETRRTADQGDFEGVLLLHSLVGGTGSGVASRLAEKIRLYFVEPPEGYGIDEVYEDKMARQDGLDGMYVEKRRAKYFVSIAVAPQSSGEVCTQGINAALSLQILQQQTDAIVLLRNDDAMTSGTSAKGSSSCTLTTRAGTFKEANEVLVSLLLPVLGYGVETAGGCVGLLVEHCAPKDARVTAGSKIISLVPTPQRTYEAFKGSVLRGCFYTIKGAKDFMPGCRAEVPVEQLLSKTALRRYQAKQQQEAPPRPKKKVFGSRWDSATEEEHEREGALELQEVPVQAPAALLAYYKKLSRAPVTKLYTEIEGVLMMNEARELNAKLMFPLLRSAALKVKVGAFLSTYQDVGVGPQRIEDAYHAVAEVLTNAADL